MTGLERINIFGKKTYIACEPLHKSCMKTEDLQSKFAAADKSVGFDYQFYFFFYLLLGLEHGQKIGLEVKDDIHIDFPDGTVLLLQTKHSVQTNANGTIINLTQLDEDLWKTMSNWSKIILSQASKKEYLDTTSFQLITNKNNGRNPLIEKLRDAQGEVKDTGLKDYLLSLKSETSNEKLKSQIDDVLKLGKDLKRFALKVRVDVNEDDLIDRIKWRILEKIYDERKVDDVYSCLLATLHTSNYLTIKGERKVEYSFDDFMKHFGGCFKKGLSSKLPIKELPPRLPDKIEDQLFIKQLVDVGDIYPNDSERMIELTTHMLKYFNNLKSWETEYGLMQPEIERFTNNAKLLWKNQFKKVYRTVEAKIFAGQEIDELEEDIRNAALTCLDYIREQVLKMDETELDIELSNGHYYAQTEDRKIGWHYAWENKYDRRQ